jgi:hypothetical protein
MSNASFVLSYAKARVRPPARAVHYEETFSSLDAAVEYCVDIEDLGGEAFTVVQFIRGREDAVLEGVALAKAIDRMRDQSAFA